MKTFFSYILLMSLTVPLVGQANSPTQQRDYWEESKRFNRFHDARYGLFIHWGVYSDLGAIYKGKEINCFSGQLMNREKIPVAEYEGYAAKFNPHKFDADQWAKNIANAGLKYLVITTKHHDGFSLWDSKVSPYNLVKHTGFKRDVIKELSIALRKHNVGLGFYYSLSDWHYANGGDYDYDDYRNTKMLPQLKELLTEYGEITNLWLDGLQSKPKAEQKLVYNFVRNLQPNVVVNVYNFDERAGDFSSRRPKGPYHNFEATQLTHNDWSFRKHSVKWQPEKGLLQKLITYASQGGNLLLNIGPTGEGEFPPEALERLNYVGDWLKANGQAIYGTGRTNFGKPDWGYYTWGNGTLYAIIDKWPKSGEIAIPRLVGGKYVKAHALSGTFDVELVLEKGLQTLKLQTTPPDGEFPVIAIDFK